MSATLGLSCPDGGKFYICDKGISRFIGCCTIDPCANGTGECPAEHLKTSSFSSDSYISIPGQDCAAPSNNSSWFTCSATPPFMGCCKNNPCANSGVCKQGNLLPARLSDIEADAQVFLSIAQGNQGKTGSGLPLGATIGIAVGGAVFVALIVGFVTYRCGWFARRRREEKSTKVHVDEDTRLYDATGDGGLGGLVALHSGTYPNQDWPAQERLQSDAGTPAPQYSAQSPGFAFYSPGDIYNKHYSDVPAEQKTHRDSRSYMSPISASSPYLASESMAPNRASSQTYGNVSELSGSYDPSYHASPPHSRNPSELTGMLPPSSAQSSPSVYSEPHYAAAMELDASEQRQSQRPRPVSELPSQNY
ncbi:cell wall integrity and stress response component [Microdochium nivale]|nr:cell wall integrity and stress response component [Microdochium nivale]